MNIFKIFPIVLAVCSILIFWGLIAKHEWHISHSQTVFVKLKPVDPRSILQGDYMVLAYDLKLHDMNDQQILNKAQIMSYVVLDGQQRVLQTRLIDQQNENASNQAIPLILNNSKNRLDAMYPAANSFLFAEALEPCYRNADYAELRVKTNGQALLVGLVNQHLKSLNCEQQKNWIEGHV